MNSERSELKYALSLFQFSLPLQERKGCLDLLNQRNRKCQVMMPRKDSADLVVAQAFDRAVEELRIRGGIKGVQTTLINQIAGIQVFSLRLIKTAVPGGCPGVCMTSTVRPPKSKRSPSCRISRGSP